MENNKKKTKEPKSESAGSDWYLWSSSSLAVQNKFLSKMVLALVGTVAVLALVIIVLVATNKGPQYFSVTPDLRVAELVPLDQPYVSPAAVSNWSAKVLTETLSFDFRHWRKILGASEKYFSKKGFKGLLKAVRDSGIVDRVEKKRLVTSLVVNGAPVIAAEGMVTGVYHWKVEVPVILEYEGASGVTNKQELLATLMVSRQDTRVKPEGIAIEQLTLSPRRR
jgi:intracellular multiplication protein IcmL